MVLSGGKEKVMVEEGHTVGFGGAANVQFLGLGS